MAYRDTRQAVRRLTAVAAAQGGYFTARQAEQAGYDPPHLTYHVNRGNFERVGRGLYRIPTVPLSEHDDLIRLTLWSRGRDDVPQAVVSHESALGLHELSDILPGKVHLTVPRSFRRAAPPECALHKADLARRDSTAWGVFRVTTPLPFTRLSRGAARTPFRASSRPRLRPGRQSFHGLQNRRG